MGGQLSGGQLSGGRLSYLALGFATIDPSVITWGVNCRGVIVGELIVGGGGGVNCRTEPWVSRQLTPVNCRRPIDIQQGCREQSEIEWNLNCKIVELIYLGEGIGS